MCVCVMFCVSMFRWSRCRTGASVTCVTRAAWTAVQQDWAPPLCPLGTCTRHPISSLQTRVRLTLHSTSTPTSMGTYPCTTCPICPDRCCPHCTPALLSHTARSDSQVSVSLPHTHTHNYRLACYRLDVLLRIYICKYEFGGGVSEKELIGVVYLFGR